AEISHVRPVDMSRGDIDCQAVWELASAFLDDRLEIGAIGIGRQHAAAPQIEKENAADRIPLVWRGRGFRECCVHVLNLPLVVSDPPRDPWPRARFSSHNLPGTCGVDKKSNSARLTSLRGGA